MAWRFFWPPNGSEKHFMDDFCAFLYLYRFFCLSVFLLFFICQKSAFDFQLVVNKLARIRIEWVSNHKVTICCIF